MRKVLLVTMMFIALLAQAGMQASAQDAAKPDIAGNWGGTLQTSGGQLRVVFHIVRNGDGSLTSKMDSLNQGAMGIPMDRTTFDGHTLHIELVAARATYDGVINDAGTEITGTWTQGGTSFPLNLTRTAETAKLNRPQEPVAPFPYQVENVAYTNQAAGIKLAGTLTIPSGKGPFPAAILITGSGAQDRDVTIMGHKFFAVIADYLTRRGVAVLRVDDRGIGGSTGKVSQSTTVDFAGDVLAGIKYLKGRPEIDPGQIGLIGHSEGGLIAPLVAAQSKDVAYIVLLAGPGLKGEEIIRLQSELILRAGGGTDADVARQSEVQDRMSAIARMTDMDEAQKALHELAVWLFDGMSAAEKQAAGNSAAGLEANIGASIMSPWYRFFIGYDPAPTLKKVTCPVLALNGSKDLQVPPKEDLAAIAAALKEGGNRDYTTIELPELNHLFQHCQTGLPAEYGKIEETFAPEALKMIGGWILQRIGK